MKKRSLSFLSFGAAKVSVFKITNTKLIYESHILLSCNESHILLSCNDHQSQYFVPPIFAYSKTLAELGRICSEEG